MIRTRFRGGFHRLLSCGFLFLFLCAPGYGSEGNSRATFGDTIEILNSPRSFQLTVPGNVDESRFLRPNLPAETVFFSSFRIKNEGQEDIVNPRLTINGFQMPLTTGELIRALTLGSSDDLDRILRIFYTMTHYLEHQELPAADQIYPLGFFLNFAYGVCYQQMAVQGMLWEVLGYPWRVADPMNHATAEVKLPRHRQTMLLDTDFNAFYLRHDNRTIASARDIGEDPMLVLRSTHERNYHRSPWQEGDPSVDMWGSSEKMAALYRIVGERPLDATAKGPHLKEAFVLRLRPGESYGWHSDRKNYHESLREHPATRRVSRQLVWETELDFGRPQHHWFVGGGPAEKRAVQISSLKISSDHTWVIPYRLLFPLLGMDLLLKPDADSENLARSGALVLHIALRTAAGTVLEDVPLARLIDRPYSLDALLQKLPYPCREVTVILSLKSPDDAAGKSLNMRGLRIRFSCQATAFAFRSLQSGPNEIIYTDASPTRHARIEIAAQPADVSLPMFAGGSFSPGGAESVAESALRFSWPFGPAPETAGYHWQLSAHRDMRYPLSPTFDRLVGDEFLRREGGKVVFELPWRGMLPVGQDLFWRVRPHTRENLAGDWSPVQSFRIRGPGVPQHVRLEEKKGRQILKWERNREGTSPVKYEIHTSSLEGFMPTGKRHRILGLGSSPVMKYHWSDVHASDWPLVPPTLLTTTRQREWVVLDENGPQKKLRQKLGAHYRIIAVDAEGSQSCPSPQIHLPHPQIASPPKVQLKPGSVHWQVPVISSYGRVLATIPDYRLGLWDRSTLAYSLLEAPGGGKDWTIDRTTGIVRGRLAKGEAVPLTVEVLDTKYGIKNIGKVVLESSLPSGR